MLQSGGKIMTHLYLIRHAAYISTNAEGHLTDMGLSETGIQQANRLYHHLVRTRKIKADVLISSTKLRALQTAEIIAPAFGLPIIQHDDLQEWRNISEGTLTMREFETKFAEARTMNDKLFRPIVDSHETWTEFMFRASNALNNITQEYRNRSVVIVCHGGILEASFLFFSGLPTLAFPNVIIDVDYTSVSHWRLHNERIRERWQLVSFNDIAHLYEA